MEHTTRETAERLHEANFPQPYPKAGQHWYDLHENRPFIITGINVSVGFIVYLDSGSGMAHVPIIGMTDIIYLPTATDTLKELDGWAIAQNTYNGKTRWTCWLPSHEPPEDDENEFYHENPAEACALAWLAKNEKK